MSVERTSAVAAKKKDHSESYWGGVFSRLRKNRTAMISIVLLVIMVLACLLVPILSPYPMYSTDSENRRQPPSAQHWLGTDDIGRDLLTRLFYGGRISLGIALVVTLIECVIGIAMGALAGYYGGLIDSIIMRLCDVFLSFPSMMICITVVALLDNIPRTFALILVFSLLGWPSIARIVRGQILTLREQEYMEACEALGISDASRMLKHLFPNVLAYVIVYATMGMASVILTETSMSFLGLGVTMPTPTWGNLIQAARDMTVIRDRWWYWIPPGICIFVSVMCFNLVGDGLRDAIDPKMKQ